MSTVRYSLVENQYAFRLEQAINDKLEEGWELVGGISTNHKGEYCQAMAKRARTTAGSESDKLRAEMFENRLT